LIEILPREFHRVKKCVLGKGRILEAKMARHKMLNLSLSYGSLFKLSKSTMPAKQAL